MAKYPDKDEWIEEILIPDRATPILGGQPVWEGDRLVDGFANVSAGQLANRTRHLKNKVEQIEADIDGDSSPFIRKENNLSDLDDLQQAKYNLGLNLVDNTRDLDKPVSVLQQEALNNKVDKDDLANPDKGAAMVGRGVVAVDSIADLRALPEDQRKGGLRYLVKGYYAGSDIGGGEFVWRAEDMSTKVSSDPYQGLCVPPADDPSGVGGAWERVVANTTIQAAWFGTIPDSQAAAMSNTARLQSAIDLTPGGWTLRLSGIGFTWLDTVPALVTPGSLALHIDHPMTLAGGAGHTLKIIPHSSAWEATGGNAHRLILVTSSDVIVEDTNLIPNASHHYTMHEGFKYWHHNPNSALRTLRGHHGISVVGFDSLISNVVIRRNTITDCAAGINASGYYNSLSNSWDRASGLPDKGVYNFQAYGNKIVQAKSNGIIFIGSVIGAIARENTLEDCMYHPLRMYSGTTDCHFLSNKIYVDYDAVASRWNQEDLGYWVSDNPNFELYKIQRSSIRLGPGESDAPLINCSACDNMYYFAPGIVSDIYDNSISNSGLQITGTSEATVFHNNRIYNCPGIGIVTVGTVSVPADGQSNSSYEVKSNTITNNVGIGMLLRGPAAGRVAGNTFIDCSGESSIDEYQLNSRSTLLATYNLNNCAVEGNHFLSLRERQVDVFAFIGFGSSVENFSFLLRGNTFSGYTALEDEYQRRGHVSNSIYGDLFEAGVESDTGWGGLFQKPTANYLVSSEGAICLGVEVRSDDDNSDPTATSDVIVTLPENIRPAYGVTVVGRNYQDDSMHYVTIDPDTGEVKVIVPQGSTRPSRLRFTVTYLPRYPFQL